MDIAALALLRDPLTGERLHLDRATDCLVNPATGAHFAIQNGVVHFLDRARVAGSDRKYMKFYDFFAPFYDCFMSTWMRLRGGGEEQRRREYLHLLEIGAGCCVLEVSIGTGANIGLLPNDATYYGLDISRGMLARCRRNLRRWGRQAVLIQGEAEHLPFADDSFDVVLHMGGINFFNDKAAALAEMVRVAKPGTRLVVVDETERIVKAYKHATLGAYGSSPAGYAPVAFLPPGMLEVAVKLIWKGDMYCLSFRKPVRATCALPGEK